MQMMNNIPLLIALNPNPRNFDRYCAYVISDATYHIVCQDDQTAVKL
jgi:hypothetical protein